VTPTNASLGSLDPARLSRLDASGGSPPATPDKEVPLHTALYQTRTSARAVVHLHSTHSVALSMPAGDRPRAALPPMTAYYLMKCAPPRWCRIIGPAIPRSPTPSRASPEKYSSVLLANHGPVVSGDTLEAACSRSRSWKKPKSSICCCAASIRVTLTPAQICGLSKTFG